MGGQYIHTFPYGHQGSKMIELDNIELHQLLAENHGTLIVDLRKYADNLNSGVLGQAFLPPEPGLYIRGSSKPLLKANVTYYTPNKRLKSIHEVVSSNSDILDIDGNILLSRQLLRDSNLLTVSPSSPIMAIGFVKSLLYDYVATIAPYACLGSYPNYRNFLKPEYQHIDPAEFEVEYEVLFNDVYDFLFKHKWNIYTIKPLGDNLIIERNCDFRVYDWHKSRLKEVE